MNLQGGWGEGGRGVKKQYKSSLTLFPPLTFFFYLSMRNKRHANNRSKLSILDTRRLTQHWILTRIRSNQTLSTIINLLHNR